MLPFVGVQDVCVIAKQPEHLNAPPAAAGVLAVVSMGKLRRWLWHASGFTAALHSSMP
jgi:hypothetical protein